MNRVLRFLSLLVICFSAVFAIPTNALALTMACSEANALLQNNPPTGCHYGSLFCVTETADNVASPGGRLMGNHRP